MSTRAWPSSVLDDEDDTVFWQLAGLMEGEGATEDHEDVMRWFKQAGMPEKLIPIVHAALVNSANK